MKKILLIALICIIQSNWISAQTNKYLTLETKKIDTINIDLSHYEYAILFDDYFCKSCFVKNFHNTNILMIYNKKGLEKIDRVWLFNNIKKYYTKADIYFLHNSIPNSFKVNRLIKIKDIIKN